MAVVVAATTAGSVAHAGEAASALSWEPCGGVWQAPKVECAPVDVPISWERPGKKITLMVGKLKHTGQGPSKGVVVTVPGGPGGSGILDLKHHEASFTELRKHFDVISFDPRGVASYDHLPKQCERPDVPLAVPDGRERFDDAVRRNQAVLKACRDGAPELFDHMDASSTARDLDAIRAALGQPQLRIIGTSYGGVYSETYARLFPRRVAALVMDGASDHLTSHEVNARDRAVLAEGHFADFIKWCATDASCALHGRDVRADWRALIEKADREPIPVPGTDLTYTGTDLQFNARPYLANYKELKQLSVAIDMAMKGSAQGFYDTFKQKPAVPARVFATECGDELHGTWRGYEDYRKAREMMRGLSAEFWADSLRGVACVDSQIPVRNPRTSLKGVPLPPILGVGTRTDIIGPRNAVSQVPGSGLITLDGYGHTMYNSGNKCVIEHVDRYLLHGKIVNLTCPV